MGGMGDFRLIERNYHDQEADSQTGNGAAGVEEAQRLAGSLEGSSQAKDDGADENRLASAEPVANRS